MVIEELRLKVPADAKVAWLNAEKEIWDPWVSSQDGFLGRELFWDKEKEEALILVNWKSKKLWKSIPISKLLLFLYPKIIVSPKNHLEKITMAPIFLFPHLAKLLLHRQAL